MPNAGLLDLVAHGVQDIYLIGNPQITFFKVVYKRHTNFSMESVQATINGTVDFGKKVTVNIPRKADLLHTMILEVDLPTLTTQTTFAGSSSTATGTITYVDNIGHALIDQVELKIGGQPIDKHYGEWMDIWTQLSQSESKKRGLDIMLDRTGSLNTTGNKTIYIPLQFWFCRNIGLALPLIALQYHEVELEITFKSLSNVTTLGTFPYYTATGTAGSRTVNLVKPDTSNTPSLDTGVRGKTFVTSDGTTYQINYSDLGENLMAETGSSLDPYQLYLETALTSNLTNDESYIKPNGELASTPTMTDCRLFIDYIYLDTYEKKEFALAKHRYLIEQLQFSGGESIESGLINKGFNLNFNLPVKELFWTIQLDRVNRNNDLFNYSNTVADGIVQGNNMEKCVILINGLERFQERKADYFRIIQPYQKHTRVPNKFFYMYSFSLKPEDHQPSGCSNFSKINTVDMNITMNQNIPQTILKVYALNYNILRIYNGMGGIAFSN